MGIFWIFYACWLFDFFRSHFVWSFAAPLRQGLWFQCGSRVGPGPSMHFQMEGGAFRGLVLSLFLEEAPAGRECFASSGKQFLHVSFRGNLSVQVVL